MSQPAGQYFIRLGTQLLGPLTLEQLRNLKERGRLQPFHSVSVDGKTWQPASSLTELFPPQSEAVPGQGQTAFVPQMSLSSVPQEAWYYLDANGQQQGPVTQTALQDLWQRGIINSDTYVWRAGMAQWQQLSSVLPSLGSDSEGRQGQAFVSRPKQVEPAMSRLRVVLIVDLALQLGLYLTYAAILDQLLGFFKNQFADPLVNPDRIMSNLLSKLRWVIILLMLLYGAVGLCSMSEALLIGWSAYAGKIKTARPAGLASAIVTCSGVLVIPVVAASVFAGDFVFLSFALMVLCVSAIKAGWFLALLFLRGLSLEAAAHDLARDFGYQILIYAIATLVVIAGSVLIVLIAALGIVLLVIGILASYVVHIWTVVDLFRLCSWLREAN